MSATSDGRPRTTWRGRIGTLALLAVGALALFGRREAPVVDPPRAHPAPVPIPVALSPPVVAGRPRGLTCAVLSMILPGAGQLLGGRRRRGVAMLAVVALLLIAAAIVLSRGATFLAVQATRPEVLIGLLGANAALLLFRGWSAVDAWRLGRRPAARLARGAAVAAVLLVAAVPHAVVAWYDWTAYDTITTVFADDAPSSIAPGLPFEAARRPGPPAAPAWPGRDRLTVLLLGGDAGPGRSGLRTDTMVVATIDVRSGHAALLSLPRNLADVPLPPAAADLAPGGRFPDILNALSGWAQAHPDRFPGGRDPGAVALKEVVANITGLRIDYYALLDFRGFVEVVDALGGVTVDVPTRVLDRVSPPIDGEDWIRIDLAPGRQHLDARQAFAYVRARSQSSDYTRIERQRCVLTGLARQAGAGRLLTAFPRLARTARRYVSTDIPRRALPDLVRLMGRIDTDRIVSVGFTPPAYTSGWVGPGYPVPDIPEIRAAAHRAATATAAARAAGALGGEVCD